MHPVTALANRLAFNLVHLSVKQNLNFSGSTMLILNITVYALHMKFNFNFRRAHNIENWTIRPITFNQILLHGKSWTFGGSLHCLVRLKSSNRFHFSWLFYAALQHAWRIPSLSHYYKKAALNGKVPLCLSPNLGKIKAVSLHLP